MKLPPPPRAAFFYACGGGGATALSYGVWQQPRPTKPYTNTLQANFSAHFLKQSHEKNFFGPLPQEIA